MEGMESQFAQEGEGGGALLFLPAPFFSLFFFFFSRFCPVSVRALEQDRNMRVVQTFLRLI